MRHGIGPKQAVDQCACFVPSDQMRLSCDATENRTGSRSLENALGDTKTPAGGVFAHLGPGCAAY
jgi:hypothetical protein